MPTYTPPSPLLSGHNLPIYFPLLPSHLSSFHFPTSYHFDSPLSPCPFLLYNTFFIWFEIKFATDPSC